jgi:hypothetical protein
LATRWAAIRHTWRKEEINVDLFGIPSIDAVYNLVYFDPAEKAGVGYGTLTDEYNFLLVDHVFKGTR